MNLYLLPCFESVLDFEDYRRESEWIFVVNDLTREWIDF